MKINKVQVISALTWAVALIGCAYLSKGTENSKYIYNLLFGGAVINFLLLSELAKKLAFSKWNKEKVSE